MLTGSCRVYRSRGEIHDGDLFDFSLALLVKITFSLLGLLHCLEVASIVLPHSKGGLLLQLLPLSVDFITNLLERLLLGYLLQVSWVALDGQLWCTNHRVFYR